LTAFAKAVTVEAMTGRLRSVGQVAAARLRAAGGALPDAARQTHAARLAIMAARLRRALPFLSALMLAGLWLCLFLGWSAAQGVFLTLPPGGIGAGIAAASAGLVVVEFCAAFAVMLMGIGLQLAHDIGRHRIRALLILASGLMLAAAGWRLTAGLPGAIQPLLGLGVLLALTAWFERVYRRPAHSGFRDFRDDVVFARHALMRAAHGE
jgi:hypothetical protein